MVRLCLVTQLGVRKISERNQMSDVREIVEGKNLMDSMTGTEGSTVNVEVDLQVFNQLCTKSGNDSWIVAQLAQQFDTECSISRVKTLKRSLGLKGIYGARLLFFVSARTNKRHHHHHRHSHSEWQQVPKHCDVWVTVDLLDELPTQSTVTKVGTCSQRA